MKSFYNLLTTKGQLIALLMGVVVILLSLVTIYSGLGSAGYEVGTDLNAILKGGGGDGFNFFNTAITLPVILIVIAFVAWIGFTLFQLISNPKSSMKMIIAFGVILVLFFLLMTMSESETTGKLADLIGKNNISEGTSKMISGGIKTTVLLALGSAIAMIALEIYNMFK